MKAKKKNMKVKAIKKGFNKANNNTVTVASVGVGTLIVSGVMAYGINKISKLVKRVDDVVKHYVGESTEVMVTQGNAHAKDIAEVYKSVDVYSHDILDAVAGVGASVVRVNEGETNHE